MVSDSVSFPRAHTEQSTRFRFLEKELSEYVLIAAGTTTTAENGETVYVIRLYEKDGTPTNVTIALNENGDYAFSTEVNKFVKIS